MTPLSIPILLHKPDQKRNKTIQRCQNQNTLHPKIPIVEHPQNIFSQPIIQSEVSQKEKHQHSILTHIYGIWKDGNNNPVYETAKETLMYRTVL